MTLDSFSQRFRAWLERHRDELVPHLGSRAAQGDPELEVLELRLAGPGGEVGLDTDDEEITVWFADWHDHYGNWLDQADEEAFALGMECFDGIVAEHLVSVCEYEGEKWCSSRLVPAGTVVRAAAGRSLKVRSWAGNYSHEASVTTWPPGTAGTVPEKYRAWDTGASFAPGEQIRDPG